MTNLTPHQIRSIAWMDATAEQKTLIREQRALDRAEYDAAIVAQSSSDGREWCEAFIYRNDDNPSEPVCVCHNDISDSGYLIATETGSIANTESNCMSGTLEPTMAHLLSEPFPEGVEWRLWLCQGCLRTIDLREHVEWNAPEFSSDYTEAHPSNGRSVLVPVIARRGKSVWFDGAPEVTGLTYSDEWLSDGFNFYMAQTAVGLTNSGLTVEYLEQDEYPILIASLVEPNETDDGSVIIVGFPTDVEIERWGAPKCAQIEIASDGSDEGIVVNRHVHGHAVVDAVLDLAQWSQADSFIQRSHRGDIRTDTFYERVTYSDGLSTSLNSLTDPNWRAKRGI